MCQTADSFNPYADGPVWAMAIQPDAKVLIGGYFSTLNGGYTRLNIARLKSDGTLDSSFNPGADNAIYSLALQPDGKILAGGGFAMLGGQARNYLGRLNADGTLDSSFDPGANGAVYCLSVQPDGKVLVGGSFTSIGGQARTNLARLNPDGSADPGFNPGVDGSVSTLALQPDGRIVVGGSFSVAGGQPRTNLCRLDSNGLVETTFNPGAGGGVQCLALQADGKIVAGGSFTKFGGQTRNRLARLNTDGSLDSAFSPEADSYVLSLAVQTDGRIVVGGNFTMLGGQTRNYIGRLNSDGTVDQTFNPGADWTVDSLALQADGKVLAAGFFWILNGQTRHNIGRLNATEAASQTLTVTGSTVTWLRGGTSPEASRTTFETSTNGINWLMLGAGTRISGGWQLSGATLPPGANLRARGFIASGYLNGSGGFVETNIGPPLITSEPLSRTNVVGTTATFSIAVTCLNGTPSFQWRKDGVILNNGSKYSGANTALLSVSNVLTTDAGGFSVIASTVSGSVTSTVATLAVIPPLDSFSPVADGSVLAFAVQTDGKVVVGGNFTSLGSQSRAHLARLNTDGSVDASFNPGASGQAGSFATTVGALAVQPDGKILVGGAFSSLAGQSRTNLGRLNPDGSLDSSFNPAPDSLVGCITLQPDGRILVGGWFDHLAGQSRICLGRLNSDGTLDSSFTTQASDLVDCLALQPDGKILVSGYFSFLGGQPHSGIGRLNADGAVDTSFNPSANGEVYCLAVQPDAKILVGGWFSTLGGLSRTNIGRLNANGTVDTGFNPRANSQGRVLSFGLQADGRILVGGNFTTLAGHGRNHVGRLNPDGTMDTSFNPDANDIVYSLAVQPDGKILLGGNFTLLGGENRARVGRLNATDPATQSLSRGPSTVTWLRGGTSPEVWRTTLDVSTNGTDWFSLGSGSRTTGGWQFSDVSIPTNSALRARGYAVGGECNGSTWYVESLLPGVFLPPPLNILVHDSGFGMRSNRFGFDVQSQPGLVVVIEASTDLANWVPIQTNLTTSLGQIAFADSQSGSYPHRYYRARRFTGMLPAPSLRTGGPGLGFSTNRFGFQLNAIPGQTLVIETSTNLSDWTPLATNLFTSNTLYFSDPTPQVAPKRFYRARVQ